MSKRAVAGDPAPAIKKGDGSYADWVVVVVHGLREYLDLPYRRLLDVVHEMDGVVEKMDLKRASCRILRPYAHESSSCEKCRTGSLTSASRGDTLDVEGVSPESLIAGVTVPLQ